MRDKKGVNPVFVAWRLLHVPFSVLAPASRIPPMLATSATQALRDHTTVFAGSLTTRWSQSCSITRLIGVVNTASYLNSKFGIVPRVHPLSAPALRTIARYDLPAFGRSTLESVRNSHVYSLTEDGSASLALFLLGRAWETRDDPPQADDSTQVFCTRISS